MHRLLILIVVTLCFVFGLMAPAFATDYCPAVIVKDGQYCICFVQNYSAANDANVKIFLYSPDGDHTCGPLTIPAGDYTYCSDFSASAGYCGCKVTGEATYTRTSLEVMGTDFTPYVAVACK